MNNPGPSLSKEDLDAKAEEISRLLGSEQVLYRRLKDNYEVLKLKHRTLEDELSFANRQCAQNENERISERIHYETIIHEFNDKLKNQNESDSILASKLSDFKSIIKVELAEKYSGIIRRMEENIQTALSNVAKLKEEKTKLESSKRTLENENIAAGNQAKFDEKRFEHRIGEERKKHAEEIAKLKLSLENCMKKVEDYDNLSSKYSIIDRNNEDLLNENSNLRRDFDVLRQEVDANNRVNSIKIAQLQSDNSIFSHKNELLLAENETLKNQCTKWQSDFLSCQNEKSIVEMKLNQIQLENQFRIQNLETSFGEERRQLEDEFTKMREKLDNAESSLCLGPDLIQGNSHVVENFITKESANREIGRNFDLEKKEIELIFKERELEWKFRIKQAKSENEKLKASNAKLKSKIVSLQIDRETLDKIGEDLNLRRNELNNLKHVEKEVVNERILEIENQMQQTILEKDLKIEEQKKYYRSQLKEMKSTCEKLKLKYDELKCAQNGDASLKSARSYKKHTNYVTKSIIYSSDEN